MVGHDSWSKPQYGPTWNGICCYDGGIKKVLSQPHGMAYDWQAYCDLPTCIFYKSNNGNKIFQCFQCEQNFQIYPQGSSETTRISSIEVYYAVGGLCGAEALTVNSGGSLDCKFPQGPT